MDAVKKNDLELINKLLAERAPVNERDDQGNTCLHYAALLGRVEIARLLLDAGADIEAPNTQFHRRPIHSAAMGGFVHMLNLLIQRGADVQSVDMHSFNCFHHAVREGQILAAHYLLSQGFDVDSVDQEGHTALHWASYFGSTQLIVYLLARGANIARQDSIGCTAMHWAATKDHQDAVKLLMDAGAPFEVVDTDNCTPLDLAQGKKLDGMCYLIEKAQLRDKNNVLKTIPRYQWPRVLFLTPFLYVPISFFVLCHLSWYLALPIALLLLPLFMFRTVYGVCTRDDVSNPVFLGYFTVSLLVSFWTFFTQVWPAAQAKHNHMALFLLGNVLFMLYFYYKSVVTDAGSLPKASLSGDEILQQIDAGLTPETFCATCQIKRPIRSKHCRKCNRCYARHDHHCPWLNNCVAENNHWMFYITVATQAISHIVYIRLVYLCLTQDALVPALSLQFFSQAAKLHPLMFYNMMHHVLQGFWITLLSVLHTWFILKNLTTNEFYNKNRYGYLKRNKVFFNPFDVGMWANTMQFFGCAPRPADYTAVAMAAGTDISLQLQDDA
eukprot:TRINITY_DN15072_c0_g1_i1.p1 TRINITY_DN15072_c0_g1~~TRINITY_DN15072_c0_g1_i1.p1  ORF type:complete len:620 (-),score=133.18 TRINITY_DN15072_c0_g1_i1:29-1690(-)